MATLTKRNTCTSNQHLKRVTSGLFNAIFFLLELCGTPGYLSPEVLQCSMFTDAPGYGKQVDM